MATMMTVESPDIAVEHERLVARTIALMRASEAPLSLDDMAEAAGLSPFYFARIFRAVAGIPPGEFQAAIRFERAKALLLTTTASVTDICFEVGYDSLGTFSSRFKRLVGIGPAEFRMMPEIVAGLERREDVTDELPALVPMAATVSGTITMPDAEPRHVYVGLYPDGIARSRPVVGQLVTSGTTFALPNVPPGTYHLLSAAPPASGTVLDQLVPGSSTVVAVGAPVVVRTGRERFRRDLFFRPLRPTDPPILTALPALRLLSHNTVVPAETRAPALALR